MHVPRFVRVAPWIAIVLVLTSCRAGPGPTGIADSGPRTVRVNGVDLLVAPPGLRPAAEVVTREIGVEGGAVVAGGGRLEVPAGALASTVSISMEGPVDSVLAYRFGPGGLTFSGGATLSISVDPAALGIDDPSRLKIAGASDSGVDWQVIGGAWDEATGTVVWEIEHFSIYGLCVD